MKLNIGNNNTYNILFVFMTIFVWSPSKIVTYISSFLILIIFVLIYKKIYPLKRLSLVLLAYFIVVLFYWFIYDYFSLKGALFYVFTYSPFFIIPCIFYNKSYRANLSSLAVFLKYLLIIQAALGLTQIFLVVLLNGGGFDLDAGDFVCGTLKPLSFLERTADFTNQIYAANTLIYLSLFVAIEVKIRKVLPISSKIVIVFSILSVIFASTLHILALWLCAIIIILFFFLSNNIKTLYYKSSAVILILLMIFTLKVLQPNNFNIISNYFTYYTSEDSIIPKVKLTYRLFDNLPKEYPTAAWIGLGPGQFSSRAAMMASGTFFGGIKDYENQKINQLIGQTKIKPYETLVDDLRHLEASYPWMTGTLTKPYYSFASIYGEHGVILFLGLLFFILIYFRKLLNLARNNKEEKLLFLLKLALLLFILLLGLTENYFETPQIILPFLFIQYFEIY